MAASSSAARGGPLTAEEVQQEAGEEFFSLLLDLKFQGKLKAKDACLLAYGAVNAGATGPAEQLGLEPGRSGSNYSRKFDSVAGSDLKDPALYYLDVPQHLHHDGSRSVKPLAARPAHEGLLEEVEDPDFEAKLRDYTTGLPAAYWDHPVVQGALPRRAIPLALYMDGIKYAVNDTMLGIFVVNLVTGRRHLVCSLRHRSWCRCGCRGWCSLWPIFRVPALGPPRPGHRHAPQLSPR